MPSDNPWVEGLFRNEPRAEAARDRLFKTMARLATVTPRGLEILQLYAEGRTVREICELLTIQQSTCRTHLDRIRVALGARHLGHAIYLAIKQEMIK